MGFIFYKFAYLDLATFLVVLGPYGISGSCMDEITFSVLWHDREPKARLMHAFYRSSGVDRVTKNGVSLEKGHTIRLHACKCEYKQNIPEFRIYCFVSKKIKKKVFATGLHALAHILGAASNCCCTTDVYRACLIFLVARTRSRRECR